MFRLFLVLTSLLFASVANAQWDMGFVSLSTSSAECGCGDNCECSIDSRSPNCQCGAYCPCAGENERNKPIKKSDGHWWIKGRESWYVAQNGKWMMPWAVPVVPEVTIRTFQKQQTFYAPANECYNGQCSAMRSGSSNWRPIFSRRY